MLEPSSHSSILLMLLLLFLIATIDKVTLQGSEATVSKQTSKRSGNTSWKLGLPNKVNIINITFYWIHVFKRNISEK